jgi:lysophospholipase L1-like esterase
MNSRFLRVIWILLAIGVVLFGVMAAPAVTATITDKDQTQTVIAPTLWIIPALMIIVVVTLLTVFTKIRPALLRNPMRWLRAHPLLYWFLLLVYLTLAVGWWVYKEQPTNGRGLTNVEFCYLCSISWLFIFLIGYDFDVATVRPMGTRLGSSKLTGVLVTLTTVLILFWGAEAYLRVFYITTDGYGFTAMNYWWYSNFYWGHYNSLGYRDHEPKPVTPGMTTIAIVGDSFTAGHGISNIDDTYPQVLEKMLGDNYDVNTVAQSGWDTDVETAYLGAYYDNLKPRLPQIVVLSYYLNDVDYILFRDKATNPNSVFSFQDLNTPMGWFVLNFFVPNYAYYNIAQFTSPQKNTNFTDILIRAHLDDKVWNEQAGNLQKFYQWTVDHNAKLIVLLWPQLAAIKESQPALQKVRDFFKDKSGVQIADISTVLEGKPTMDLLVNRFDSHPSIEANKLAAEMLYGIISGKPS